ncbi:MAG: carbon-nitrogen hydrolase family protein [Anaerotignum sp.]
MGRFLNVGLIQMPISQDTVVNLKYIEEKVAALMSGYHKPELIVGVECIQCFTPEYIPGAMTEFFSGIAKKYGIYFIPGTMYEKHADLPEGIYYNSAPIFNPKGELVDVYRKMAPWRPSEAFAEPGRRYVVFDIPEKQTKVGVQICYDLNFPEISRNETLMGAEILVKLTMDPQELYYFNKPLHFARAIENQAYMISTNGVGFFNNIHMYGNSLVVNPEGQLLWEAGQEATIATLTLDLDLVTRTRQYGTMFVDHYLQHLRDYNFPMPYADDVSKAPVFETIRKTPVDPHEYEEDVKSIGVCQIGNMIEIMPDVDQFEKNLDEFLNRK